MVSLPPCANEECCTASSSVTEIPRSAVKRASISGLKFEGLCFACILGGCDKKQQWKIYNDHILTKRDIYIWNVIPHKSHSYIQINRRIESVQLF